MRAFISYAVIMVAFVVVSGWLHVADALSDSNGDEFVKNGNFETLNDQAFPDGFHVSRFSGKAEAVADERVYRSAGRSVRIEGDGDSRIAVSTERFDVLGGETYKFTVWYRSVGDESIDGLSRHIVARLQSWSLTSEGKSEKLLWNDRHTKAPQTTTFEIVGRENLHLFPGWETGEGEWRSLEAVFQLPEETAHVQVNLFNWFGDEAIWYDDVSLVRLTDADIDWEGADPINGFDDSKSVLSTLKADHPRVLASIEDFKRIEESIHNEGLTIEWYASLQSTANSLIYQSPSIYELPDGKRLLSTSRRVLDRVETLAMMYRLTRQSEYAVRAWEELEAATNFPDWNPSHFLDTAEMTRAFAIGYDWLYDFWTDEQRLFLRTAIVEKGLRPAMDGYRGSAPWRNQWARRTNNWNFVVNSGITMGALAIAEEEPRLAEDIIREGLYSINFAIDRFAPDGGWDEGVGYWHYSVRYLIPYIAALETALGNDFGLADTPGIAETGYFPIYMIGPTGSFNFADSGSGTVRAPELFWLGNRFDISAYSWWQRGQSSAGSSSARNLLWYSPGAGTEFQPVPDQLPLDRYFRQVEVVSFRSAWEDRKATFVGLKAGINAMHHNDLDVGTFVFDALGVRWIEALGADNYNLPGYFNYTKGRWDYYRKRTEGRNTIVFNPGEGPGQNLLTHTPARFLFQKSTDTEAVAVADLTPAYERHASQVHRGVALFDGRRQLLIQDEVKTSASVEFWSFMHTKAEIDIDASGQVATLRQGDLRMVARILSPSEATFISMPASPLPNYPNPPGQASNANLRKLAVQLDSVTDLRLVIQLTPLEERIYAPFTPDVVPLEMWPEFDLEQNIWGSLPRNVIVKSLVETA